MFRTVGFWLVVGTEVLLADFLAGYTDRCFDWVHRSRLVLKMPLGPLRSLCWAFRVKLRV